VVWGGDWNHAMTGPESAGSLAGRAAIARLAGRLDLRVPTPGLPHRLGGAQRTIDHIAVPAAHPVRLAHRIPARHLSDHDADVVAFDLHGSNERRGRGQVNVGRRARDGIV
jgi:hypothetical protein